MNVKVWLSISLRYHYGNWQSVDDAHCLSPSHLRQVPASCDPDLGNWLKKWMDDYTIFQSF